jgi:hypothetical protein
MDEFKVVICGSRDFEDYPVLRAFCDKILSNKAQTHKIVVVSGTAKGADTLGERYADEKGYACLRYPADWERFGRSAGMRRNERMLDESDGVIAFSKNGSRGTEHMITVTKAAGKKCAVYREGQ